MLTSQTFYVPPALHTLLATLQSWCVRKTIDKVIVVIEIIKAHCFRYR